MTSRCSSAQLPEGFSYEWTELALQETSRGNAGLIVEFARHVDESGKSRFEAAVEAARTRRRSIPMTSFAFIFGVVPLMLATGPGQEMRQALGTAVFFGMLGVTLFGLIFTPVFYVVCRWISERLPGAKRKQQPPADTPEAQPVVHAE